MYSKWDLEATHFANGKSTISFLCASWKAFKQTTIKCCVKWKWNSKNIALFKLNNSDNIEHFLFVFLFSHFFSRGSFFVYTKPAHIYMIRPHKQEQPFIFHTFIFCFFFSFIKNENLNEKRFKLCFFVVFTSFLDSLHEVECIIFWFCGLRSLQKRRFYYNQSIPWGVRLDWTISSHTRDTRKSINQKWQSLSSIQVFCNRSRVFEICPMIPNNVLYSTSM